MVHVDPQPRELVEELHDDVLAMGRVGDLGWYWTPQILRAGSSSTATGAPSEVAVATKPSGTSTTALKWLIHTVWCVGQRIGEQGRPASGIRCNGPAVLTGPAATDPTTELLGDELGAVADPQDRDPQVVHLGVHQRRTLDHHRLRATGEDDGGRIAGCELRRGDVVGNDLGVDVRLADPPCDQLRVLRTEVDDEGRLLGTDHLLGLGQRPQLDSGALHRATARASVGSPLRRRRPVGPLGWATTARSAFCISFTVPCPVTAIVLRNAPIRLDLPSARSDGPKRTCSNVPTGSTCSSRPRGSVRWAAVIDHTAPPPGASVARASGAPSITASAPHTIAFAMSPPVVMPPSAITWT